MPEPLITFSLYEQLAQVEEISDKALQVEKIKELVQQLPLIYMSTLRHMMKFLKELTEHESQNRMNSYNCAVCIGPNIFRPADRDEVANSSIYLEVMVLMIEQWGCIFDGEEYEADRVEKP